MSARFLFSLMGLLMFGPGHLLSSEEITLAKNTQIFFDGFESGNTRWTSVSGDNDGTRTSDWSVAQADDARHGSGIARVSNVTIGDICLRSNKIFASPLIQHDGSAQLALSFWYRLKNVDPESRADFFRVGILDENNQPVDGRIKEYSFLQDCDGWRQVFLHMVDMPETLRIALEFKAPVTVCTELQIDDVSLVAIGDGPPDTQIVSPDPGRRRIVRPGESVVLEATANRGAHTEFTWLIVSPGRDPQCLQGTVVEFTPPTKGPYAIACYATDSDGLSDPTPEGFFLSVTEERDLDTVITDPMERRVLVAAGSSREFTASSPSETDNPDIGFAWKVAGAHANRRLEPKFGQTVTIDFPKKGRFEILCSATDGDPTEPGIFFDPSPARIDVEVVDVLVDVIDTADPDAPGRLPVLSAGVGNTVNLAGTLVDPRSLATRNVWRVLERDETICADSLTCSYTFPEAGVYTLAHVVLNADNDVLGFDAVRYQVDTPLFLLTQPDEQLEVELGEDFSLEVMVKGLLADDPDTRVNWMFKGQTYEGPVLEFENAAIPGHHQARVVVKNPKMGAQAEKRIMVMVHDPAQKGRPRITSPQSDWRVPVGGTLFFDSAFPQMPGHKKNPYWEIVSQDGTTTLVEGNTTMLGRVTFEEAGIWFARLYVLDHTEKELMDEVKIWVEETPGSAGIEENTDIDKAAFVENGTYQGFALDRGHYYKIAVEEHQTLQVWIDPGPTGEAKVVFEPTEGELVFREVVGKQVLQIAGLPPGQYRWGVLPKEEGSKAKTGLNFSFGVNVFNPALYFTDISEDADMDTELGVVNTTNSRCDVQMVAYDADGNILDQVSRSLEPKGAIRESVRDMFPDTAGTVSWVRADSTHSVVGFAHTLSTDKTKAYGVNAATYLQDELFLPHIARDTVTWSTRANIINGEDETSSSFLVAGSFEELIDNSSYAKRSLDLVATLGGSVPEDAGWGRFFDESGNATLAGNEIFGTVDGTNQTVGLGLFGGPADNPNFSATTDTLYFTHIAQNSDFWTGIALVNLADFDLGVAVNAYGVGGVALEPGVIELKAREKKVWVADNFFAEAGIEGEVQWMELGTEANVAGYELFGTAIPGRQAGLEATSDASTEICMPFVDVTGEMWHGLAVVNVGTDATSVTFTLRNDVGGEATAPKTIQLAAKEKQVFTLSQLFGEIPLTSSWVEITSDEPIVGFELFGNEDQTHMSGLLAQ
ncbi:MAG: hypothetical protein QNK37_12715 [Acidobacteriota bacterium]|nr:hypothetical protein [Acidobacteriota bacterium]